MTRFVAWRRESAYSCIGACFDVGITTQRALANFEHTGEPFAGSTAPDDAGNGSIMRLAPAVLYGLRSDDGAARDLTREQGRITHGAPRRPRSLRAARRRKRDAIQGRRDPLRACDGEFGTRVGQIARGTYQGKTRDETRSSGYVVDTLEAALWCASTTDSLRPPSFSP